MGGDDDLIRFDPPAVSDSLVGHQLQHLGVLVDIQPPGDMRRELERMKLRLLWEPHGPGDGEGQRQFFGEGGTKTEPVKRLQLCVERPSVIEGIHKGVLPGEVAVDLPAQILVPSQCLLVSIQIQLSLLYTKSADKPVIDQTVLGGDLGRGVAGDATADPISLHQHIIYIRVRQLARTQKARDPAADDQHVGSDVRSQRIKFGYLKSLPP